MSTTCNSACATALPTDYSGACPRPDTRKAGIKRLVIFTCDATFDPTSDTAVASAKTAGDVIVSPILRTGSKPKPTANKVKTVVDIPDDVVNYTHTVEFASAAVTTTDTDSDLATDDFEFWTTLFAPSSNYTYGWLDSNGKLYADRNATFGTDNPGIDKVSIEGGQVIGEDGANGEPQTYEGTLEWTMEDAVVWGYDITAATLAAYLA